MSFFVDNGVSDCGDEFFINDIHPDVPRKKTYLRNCLKIVIIPLTVKDDWCCAVKE